MYRNTPDETDTPLGSDGVDHGTLVFFDSQPFKPCIRHAWIIAFKVVPRFGQSLLVKGPPIIN